MSTVLLIATQPIRTTEQICEKIKTVSELGYQVCIWSYFEVPREVREVVTQVHGPQHSHRKGSQVASQSNYRVLAVLSRIYRLVRRVISVVQRKIANRFRRDFAWLLLRTDNEIRQETFDVVAAIDSRAIFPAWKLQKRYPKIKGLANLTNLVQVCKRRND